MKKLAGFVSTIYSRAFKLTNTDGVSAPKLNKGARDKGMLFNCYLLIYVITKGFVAFYRGGAVMTLTAFASRCRWEWHPRPLPILCNNLDLRTICTHGRESSRLFGMRVHSQRARQTEDLGNGRFVLSRGKYPLVELITTGFNKH